MSKSVELQSPIGARRMKTDLLTSESVFSSRSRSNSPAVTKLPPLHNSNALRFFFYSIKLFL